MRKIIYSGTDKMRELIKDNNQLLPVLSRFDIAFGFGDGKVSEDFAGVADEVSQACSRIVS